MNSAKFFSLKITNFSAIAKSYLNQFYMSVITFYNRVNLSKITTTTAWKGRSCHTQRNARRTLIGWKVIFTQVILSWHTGLYNNRVLSQLYKTNVASTPVILNVSFLTLGRPKVQLKDGSLLSSVKYLHTPTSQGPLSHILQPFKSLVWSSTQKRLKI